MEHFYKYKLEEEQLKFASLRDKKILLYGSGKNARLLIEKLQDFNIVGIIDRTYVEGNIQNIPIFTWDDVNENTADVIIITSSVKNFREIFLRIKYDCLRFHLQIYTFLGQNLSSPYYYSDYTYEETKSLNISQKDLFDMIDKYDAISFDLFDTLIMRKVLEPVDIFDLVERKIQKHNIHICNFKKKRQTAELNSEGADIFAIYKELKKIINVSDDELSLIMREELACEKANIIPRYCIIEAFYYALEKGKIVSIVSNMYFPYDIVQDILNDIGIKRYDNLFISCEYGKLKSKGLFEVYQEKIGIDKKFLHIGDNYVEDILSAEKKGITAFYVNSGLELLKMSKINNLLLDAHGFGNRLFIGLIVSKLFNNPFILYNTSRYVPISSIKIFTEVFIAPVVYIYIKKLLKCIYDNQYEGIIFTAKNGYIFSYLYDKYKKNDSKLPPYYYLTISKKVAGVLKESKKKKEVYIDYIKKLGIDLEKNYLLCELNFDDTIYYVMNKLFSKNLTGFYLTGNLMILELKDSIKCLYSINEGYNVISRTDMLEAVLSSPKSLVGGIDNAGNLFYELEERTSNDINMMLDMQKHIEEFIEQWENTYENLELIDLTLLNNLLALIDGTKLFEDIKEFFRKGNMTDTILL